LWEVMDTITVTNNADIEFIVVVNTDFWNGLPEEHREIIAAAAKMAEDTVRDEMSNIEATAFAEAEQNGMTIYTPTTEEMTAWKAASQPVYDAFIERTGDTGRAMLEAAQSF
ncbi:MAG: TRAP transporter substrate-binding protein DctP, partial [Rhodovulum sp.]